MSARAATVLGRFPAHLEAARPDKLLGHAATAVADDLDQLAAALAAVRRAHRLGDADELADLWRLAAMNGMVQAEFEIVLQRWRRARELLAALQAAGDDAAREAAAEALAALWSLQALPPRLAAFADPETPADSASAAARMAAQVGLTLRHGALANAVRTRIATTAALHLGGNGTVLALLRGAANALDLQIGPVLHSADRYWHAARVTDRLRLAAPDGVPLPVAEELLGIEENPLWRAETDNTPRSHAELFTVLRRGFERALLQVRITGEGGRTVAPMLVNRDEGHGVGYDGIVPNGAQLVFEEDGRVLLDDADVTANAYAWNGACFAGDDASADADFVFAGAGIDPKRKVASFASTTPAAALDRAAAFPSDGASLAVPGIAVGVTRLAFFVREAHFAATGGTPKAAIAATPRSKSAIFDAAVFAPPPLPRTGSALVALSWLEHRAFAVRLLIPPRFRNWRADEAEGAQTLQALGRALERHRPLGVELRIEFIDDRWTLGSGTLTSGIDDDPIESLRAGTTLWPAPPANE
ncbi:hypothetical protein [Variovorax rhizosphaerae]|uniref:Baseplate protein J-like domain-containing protein n=1 Tax=Variovorax rhizosphaerae TaxID=1836200 RepID=A0ABU8WPQ8_9BURK